MSKKVKDIPYLKIIQEAIQIVWKNTYLWWFGFFVALVNLVGLFNYHSRSTNNEFNLIKKQEFIYWSSQNIYWLIVLIFLVLLVYILLISLNVLGRGALIDSIYKQIEKKPANFKTGILAGKRYFWKILFIGLVISMAMFFLIIAIFTPVIFLLSIHDYLVGILLGLVALFILVPLLLLAIFLRNYSYLYLVLGQLNIEASLESAYNLLQKNIMPSFVMLLLFIPLNILWLVFLFMLILSVGFIFLFLGMLMFFLAGGVGVVIITLLFLISFLGIVIFLLSIYKAFIQAVWILFFQIIAEPEDVIPIKEKVLVKETSLNQPAVSVIKN